MPMKFETGTGVMWRSSRDVVYGVVMAQTDGVLDVVPVHGLSSDMKCYDEGGAVKARHRDNVRLRDCPPPFTLLCAFAERSGCYAHADPAAAIRFSPDDVMARGLVVVDGGAKVSERDMAEIRDHPWRDEKEADRKEWRPPAPEPRPVPEPVKPKPMSAMDRLRAAAALTDGIAERDAGPDGPEF